MTSYLSSLAGVRWDEIAWLVLSFFTCAFWLYVKGKTLED